MGSLLGKVLHQTRLAPATHSSDVDRLPLPFSPASFPHFPSMLCWGYGQWLTQSFSGSLWGMCVSVCGWPKQQCAACLPRFPFAEVQVATYHLLASCLRKMIHRLTSDMTWYQTLWLNLLAPAPISYPCVMFHVWPRGIGSKFERLFMYESLRGKICGPCGVLLIRIQAVSDWAIVCICKDVKKHS